MNILAVVNPRDRKGMSLFSEVATRVYRDDPVWVPQSENSFIQRFETSDSGRIKMWPFVVLEGNNPVARATAIFDQSARDDHGNPQGWIAFFEYMREYEAAAAAVLEKCGEVLTNSGAKSVLAPKADNQLVGLLTDGFTEPQTVLTGYNPSYYLDTFIKCGYEVITRIKTLKFAADTVKRFDFKLPGFTTRKFDRNNLERETAVFHTLQNSIFGGRDGYVARTREEDDQMVKSLLPFIDDELVIIAEDHSRNPVGLLVCLPDIYQSYKGEKVDRARIISIGILPGWRYGGVGVMMSSQLMKNLLCKGYKTAEASWILEGNKEPQNMVKRFNATAGREFVMLGKKTAPD